jgi:tetratricopeptide (TPR) repeat protein
MPQLQCQAWLRATASNIGWNCSSPRRLWKQIRPRYRAALEELTRERVPLDWATTQNDLSLALFRLGEREAGAARLEEAVTVFRAALEERTRERVALQWATTQTSLGIALFRLGERQGKTALLEEAITAFRAALEERTRERVPLQWATTQTNLGIALFRLGLREAGTERLKEAVTAYCAALKERTRERVPLDWVMTQTNLGAALLSLGERESGTARLQEAVIAIDAALISEETDHYAKINHANRDRALRALAQRNRKFQSLQMGPMRKHEIIANEVPSFEISRQSRKIGRNDICPCGSGKKYKNCCGRRPPRARR